MSNNSNDPWAWAGLLKWSLNYVDGTETAQGPPMSDEDKAFLEKVMREGIIDEGERMKEILTQCSTGMEYYQSQASSGNTTKGLADPPITEDEFEDLLQELRDIVEQIDYARAFCSLQGLPFLLGCVTQQTGVPDAIRMACLGILSTLCQNNPPVQQQLLELGAIKSLSDLCFEESSSTSLKAKAVQAISSIVRSHELAENVFSQLDQAVPLFQAGLESASQPLKTRTLFFLRAFITSDASDDARVQCFAQPVCFVLDHYLSETNPPNLREMALALLTELLDRKLINNNKILEESRKKALVGMGVQRISTLRSLTGDDKEFAKEELELWERCLVMLARIETP